jgi:hypothetical protein
MKQLTTEQQEEMFKMIEHLSKEDALMNKDYYIDKAKAFLQSLKPKVYVCQNNGGFFYFFSKSVLNEDFVVTESDAHIFDSPEQAEMFIDEYKNKDYPLYVVIA